MFCLPESLTEIFKEKLKDGTINPEKLSEMTSDERRSFFSEFLGESNAKQVNYLFESKLLLKDQQRGIINWAKSVAGMKPDVLRDIVSRVNKMTEVLNPKTQEAFLADLAAHKLGTTVTMEEAAKISELAKSVTEAKEAMLSTPANSAERIAYGNKLIDMNEYVNSLKPTKGMLTWQNIVNLPKSLLTSVFHFSASFVQGWGMISTPEFWKALPKQLDYFRSPQAYKDLQASIISHPDYKLALDGKLGLTALGDKLSLREEAIQSSILEHLPSGYKSLYLKDITAASSRAFTGFLNNIRFSRFVTILEAARLAGENVNKGSRVITDIAKTVNDFTGRGNIGSGGKFNNFGPDLNTAFFSPRKISATIEMFDPIRYLDPKISPTAKAAALRQLVGSIIVTGSVLSLAKLAGASINLNPTNTEFLKMKVGNTTFDMTGGNAIYARLWGRLIMNKSTSSSGVVTQFGQGYKPETRADLIFSYLRGKLSPSASVLVDALYGTDVVGHSFSVKSEAYNKLVPIVMQNFINLGMNDPHNVAAWLPSLSTILGVEMQSKAPKK